MVEERRQGGQDATEPSAVFVLLGRIASNPGTWLIAGSIVLGVITVMVGTEHLKPGEEPNRLATSLLQGIALVFGTVGSYVLGRDTSRGVGEARVREHAKSAFRRVLTLYGALGRLRDKAEAEMEFLAIKGDGGGADLVRLDLALASLDKLRVMSLEQIATGEDALEDWRDLAPDEVARIENKAKTTTALVEEEEEE